VKSSGQKKTAVHVPSSSRDSTVRNSDPGSADTQALQGELREVLAQAEQS
jgi:hypothetical protein